jgi:hypothetical protein
MAVEKASFTVAGLQFRHSSVENLSIRGIKKDSICISSNKRQTRPEPTIYELMDQLRRPT